VQNSGFLFSNAVTLTMPEDQIAQKQGADRKEDFKLTLEEKEKQELLSKGRVSLIIDSYTEIFSDFDSREYHKRALSDDFLSESKKISKEIEGAAELRFLIPKTVRNQEDEKIIKRRLKEHFKKQHKILADENQTTKRNSILLAGAGFAMMIGATLIRVNELHEIFYTVLLVILEPAGWFSLWFALDQLFYASKEKKHELEFYSKMSNAEIIFEEY